MFSFLLSDKFNNIVDHMTILEPIFILKRGGGGYCDLNQSIFQLLLCQNKLSASLPNKFLDFCLNLLNRFNYFICIHL